VVYLRALVRARAVGVSPTAPGRRGRSSRHGGASHGLLGGRDAGGPQGYVAGTSEAFRTVSKPGFVTVVVGGSLEKVPKTPYPTFDSLSIHLKFIPDSSPYGVLRAMNGA
jgi:hypothetical protein